MNVRWVVQANLLSENDIKLIQEACIKVNAEFEGVAVVPFSDDVPYFTVDEKVNVYYGSTKFIEAVDSKLKFPKGIFFCSGAFQMSNYIAKWGERMLNYGSFKTTLHEFSLQEREPNGLWFVRPDADDKSFAGEVMSFEELQDWAHKVHVVTLVDGVYNAPSELTVDTPIIVGPAYNVEKEWRTFVVDGAIVASSMYRKNHKLYKEKGAPDDVLNFVKERIAEYSPSSAFVMDVALCNGEYFIVECGCINSAGFYYSDVDAIVSSISNMVCQ